MIFKKVASFHLFPQFWRSSFPEKFDIYLVLSVNSFTVSQLSYRSVFCPSIAWLTIRAGLFPFFMVRPRLNKHNLTSEKTIALQHAIVSELLWKTWHLSGRGRNFSFQSYQHHVCINLLPSPLFAFQTSPFQTILIYPTNVTPVNCLHPSPGFSSQHPQTFAPIFFYKYLPITRCPTLCPLIVQRMKYSYISPKLC